MARPSQPNTPAVREAIRAAMARRGWNRQKLAEEATKHRATGRVHKATITKILGNRQDSISEDILVPIATALGADLSVVAEQTQLQLEIVREFMDEAIIAIDQHVMRVHEDLREASEGAELVGSIGLRLEERPHSRVYEKTFRLRPPMLAS